MSHANGSSISGALTYPNRNETPSQPVPVQPRQPRNLQGLLRFAMEATKAEDAPGNSELGPMDEERRRFLEEALKSMTIDVLGVLQDAIKVLTDSEKIRSIQLGQSLPEDIQLAFANILEFVDDIDIANDFYKIGGFAIFPVCYGSENEEIRAKTSFVLAELCQNNPFCQSRALECGLFNILLNLLQSERGNALTKCLYAISSISREFDPACHELISQGGCEALAQVLNSPEPSTRTKAAFLIKFLCQRYDNAKEIFIKQNLVKTITELIKMGRDDSTEHLLSTLLTLLEGMHPAVLQQFRDPTIRLKNILEDHLKHPDLEGERFAEEKEYCKELLKQISQNCPEVATLNEEEADR